MENKRKEYAKIYDTYIGKIYRFVFLKVSSQEIAEDLTSETFLKGWEAFQQNKIDNPQAFLYRIARNLVVDHYRIKGRTQMVSVENVPIPDTRFSIEDRAAVGLDIEQIKTRLSDLSEDYQNVIIWHYLDDLPISQVANLLGRSEDATRVLLHRALESLRKDIRTA
jgi:RNA polymerase sigma-70 factor (ECF subfamily)